MKFIFYFFIFLNFLYSSEKETITWLINDAPPFYINDGEYKNQGFGDLSQKIIISDLKKYKHRVIQTTLSRAIKDFQHKKKVCFSTWIFNSTPDFVITSIPNLYYEPLGIISLKENKDKFGQTPIILDNLMSNKEFTFIQGVGRGYGNVLDNVVNKYKEESNFKTRKSSKDTTNAIFEMIKRKRVDYTIDYYSSLSFYNAINKKKKDLIFLPIKENFQRGTIGSIACTKSSWGEKVIEDINDSIKKLRTKKEYKKTFTKWLVPKENSENYWYYYKYIIENYQ